MYLIPTSWFDKSYSCCWLRELCGTNVPWPIITIIITPGQIKCPFLLWPCLPYTSHLECLLDNFELNFYIKGYSQSWIAKYIEKKKRLVFESEINAIIFKKVFYNSLVYKEDSCAWSNECSYVYVDHIYTWIKSTMLCDDNILLSMYFLLNLVIIVL